MSLSTAEIDLFGAVKTASEGTVDSELGEGPGDRMQTECTWMRQQQYGWSMVGQGEIRERVTPLDTRGVQV